MTDIWKIKNIETGETVKEFDVSDMDDRTRDKFFDGLILKVDLERFWIDQGVAA